MTPPATNAPGRVGPLDAVYRRVNALVPLIDAVDVEILAVAGPLRVALPSDRGFRAVQRGLQTDRTAQVH
jgi:hypothetical protein